MGRLSQIEQILVLASHSTPLERLYATASRDLDRGCAAVFALSDNA
jgi:hypothetical protein